MCPCLLLSRSIGGEVNGGHLGLMGCVADEMGCTGRGPRVEVDTQLCKHTSTCAYLHFCLLSKGRLRGRSLSDVVECAALVVGHRGEGLAESILWCKATSTQTLAHTCTGTCTPGTPYQY